MSEAAIDQPMGEAPMEESATQGTFGEESRPSIEKFESWESLEKGYQELESYMGNAVRIPGENAGAEDWAKFDEKLANVPGLVRIPDGENPEAMQNFYQSLGKPADVQGYQFEPIEGLDLSREDDAAFAEASYNANLTREQANYMRSFLADNLAGMEQSAQEAQQESIGALKQKWGKAFDHNVSLATAAAKQLDGELPGIAEYMENTDPNEMDANTVTMLNLMAGLMGETGAIDTGRPAGVMTPEEAMLQAQEIRNNPDHPYNNELDPAHQSAQKKMADLYKMAYGR